MCLALTEGASRAQESHRFGQVIAVDQGALRAQSALDRRHLSGTGVGVLGRGNATRLPGREGGAHDAKRRARHLVAVGGTASGEQWRGCLGTNHELVPKPTPICPNLA